MHLFSTRSQMTSKCGKNISDTLGCASCATFLFLSHFYVICDLLLNRCMATWNLFVKYIDICFKKCCNLKTFMKYTYIFCFLIQNRHFLMRKEEAYRYSIYFSQSAMFLKLGVYVICGTNLKEM